MDSQDKKFDPHSLLPKSHPLHPEHTKPKSEEPADQSSKESPSQTPELKDAIVLMGTPIATPSTVDTLKGDRMKTQNEKPAFTTQKKQFPFLKVTAVFIFLLLISGIGVYLWMNGYLTQLQVLSPLGPISPVASGTDIKSVAVGEVTSWKTYTSTSQGFTIRHPANIVPTELTEGSQIVTVFTLVGPSQKKDTEFYDGISLQFLSGELGPKTLEEFAGDEAAEISQHAKVTKQPSAVTVSGINGYEFSAEGVGEVTFIYLPDGGAYLKIANLTKDPTNQGYEKIVTDMLATLRFTEEGNTIDGDTTP